MDPKLVSIAIAVVSGALAGLGLLVSWYRREERNDEHKSTWPFLAAGISILVLAVTGVTLTFVFGAYTKNTSISTEPSTGAKGSDVPTRLSAAQYREKVSAACSDAKVKATRIEKSSPQETALGAAIKIEQEELAQIESLQPPDKLKSALQQHVKDKLAPFKYPRYLEFVPELPKTATGKIQRFRLREREQAAR